MLIPALFKTVLLIFLNLNDNEECTFMLELKKIFKVEEING